MQVDRQNARLRNEAGPITESSFNHGWKDEARQNIGRLQHACNEALVE